MFFSLFYLNAQEVRADDRSFEGTGSESPPQALQSPEERQKTAASSLIQLENVLKTKELSHTCDRALISDGQAVISNRYLNIREREKILDLFFTICKSHPDFINKTVVSWVMDLDIEWYLREKMLLFHNEQSKECSEKMTNHLLRFFFSMPRHIRRSLIWLLTDVKPRNLDQLLKYTIETTEAREQEISSGISNICDQKIIAFLSRFVQKDSQDMPLELRDFRQYNIQSVLYALARMTVKTGDPAVVSELKAIAMNQDINIYFRVSAVEVLQDLSLYFDSSAQALYDIVRDNKKVSQSGFITRDQKVRDHEDEDRQVSYRAFSSLRELSEKEPEEFFRFLFTYRKNRDDSHLYRKRFFSGLPLPEELDKYSLPVLTALSRDSKTASEYPKSAVALD